MLTSISMVDVCNSIFQLFILMIMVINVIKKQKVLLCIEAIETESDVPIRERVLGYKMVATK